MKLIVRAVVLGVVWCLCTSPAFTQVSLPIDTGARIRVTRGGPTPGQVTGSVERIASDTLWLASGRHAEPVAVPFGTIQRLEVSRGRRSAVGGALVGGAIGAGLGATGMLVWAASSCFSATSGHCPTGGTAAGITVGSAALGAVVGAAVMRGERWSLMPLTRGRQVPGGGLALEIQF